MSALIFALTRTDIANYVHALFIVYLILLFIRILLSWIPRLPYNRALNAVVTFIHDVTDPYLRLFRRILPPVGGGGFALDLSPIIGIIVIYVLDAVIVGAIHP